MIHGITHGPYITVSGGAPAVKYIPSGSPAPTGQLKFNPSTSCIEVFDGSTWVPLNNNYTTITLDNDTAELIEWVRKKKKNSDEYEKLAKDVPAISIALDKLKKAEQDLELITTISKNYETTS